MRCNQNCTYCTSRSGEDDRAFVHPRAVRARVDEALSASASTLTFTGGEPALRRDIAELVAYARSCGAKSVVLETNATPIDDAKAAALREAGLDVAVVNLAGFADALDDVTRDPGGFQRTLAGLRALGRAGVRVELSTVLVRSTLSLAATLPTDLARELGPDQPVKAIVLAIPVRGPRPDELVSYEEAAEVVLSLDAAAKAAGILVRMSPDASLPPCVFPRRAKVWHLFSLTRGGARRQGFAQVAACAECVVADRCPASRATTWRAAPSPRSRRSATTSSAGASR
jgi:wyosine [tRNA(Phe)-imidazoG37] synthetase (radical SAM superfamily)